MSADIIPSGILTKGEVPVPNVIGAAADEGLAQVFILGRCADGKLYAAASTGCTGDLLLMVEEWKHTLLSGGYGGR